MAFQTKFDTSSSLRSLCLQQALNTPKRNKPVFLEEYFHLILGDF